MESGCRLPGAILTFRITRGVWLLAWAHSFALVLDQLQYRVNLVGLQQIPQRIRAVCRCVGGGCSSNLEFYAWMSMNALNEVKSAIWSRGKPSAASTAAPQNITLDPFPRLSPLVSLSTYNKTRECIYLVGEGVLGITRMDTGIYRTTEEVFITV